MRWWCVAAMVVVAAVTVYLLRRRSARRLVVERRLSVAERIAAGRVDQDAAVARIRDGNPPPDSP